MKTKFFFFLVLLMNLHNTRAQFSIDDFKTPAQQMVENALIQSLFITRGSFQIKNIETGELYGLNGKSQFGECVSFGVKLDGGTVILFDDVVRPWMHNEKFEKYRNEYVPVLSGISYAEFGDNEGFQPFEINMDNGVSLCDSMMYNFENDAFDGKGLELDCSIGQKNGWLLWVTISKEAENNNSSVMTAIVQQKEVEIKNNGSSFEIDAPNTERHILGGLFVVPYYNRIGSIDFFLAGIIQSNNNKWSILCPFHTLRPSKAENSNQDSVDNSKPVATSEELTPISTKDPKRPLKKKDKNKK